MANDTIITVIGNATSVELRFTPSGKPVANFQLASTPRNFDRNRNEWVDGDTMWISCSAFGDMAEHLVEAIGDQKSARVIVWGKLKSRSYEAKDGTKRTVFEVDVEEVGPSLRFATATVQRAQRGQQQPQRRAQPDPWAQTNYDTPQF